MVASYLHIGFKQGSSTDLCTSVMQETISYCVHDGLNVYGLMLIASTTFDHMHYYILFIMLLERNVRPL